MNAVAPVAIVGAGPAGVRVAQELHRRAPARDIVLIGAEPCEPYDRVRLSSALAGDVRWQSLSRDASPPERVATRYGVEVLAIERGVQQLRLSGGERQPYSSLVLATGSRAHVPGIPGADLPGVFTFRDLADAQKLVARRARSRRTVVLGGGLLGLEAARAMRRLNTAVTVIEHADRLMARQLDADAAEILRRQVQALGIEVVTADGAAALLGDSGAGVRGARLRSGREIACDTVLIATGIVPDVRLALEAGLAIRRGIRVDDELRSSDPSIYAVGECAEHEGIVYGLAAPCLEQAAIAAARIAGLHARYRGSVNATRLKLFNMPVFAAGLHPDRATIGLYTELHHRGAGNRYRKLLVSRGRLAGVLGIGEWDELPRVLEAVQQGRRVSPIARWRFRRSGELWRSSAGGAVAQWPAQATVCNCSGVTRGQLTQAIAEGCASLPALAQRTRASTVCGSCKPLLENLLGAPARPAPTPLWRPLLGSAAIALAAALLLGLLPGVSYLESWSGAGWQWDRIWRDSVWKQASGYTLLGLSALALLLSLRKRLPAIAVAPFWIWRYAHVLLGLAAVAVLLAHTGGRLGHGLNAWLMTSFLAVVAAGALAAGLIALEHRLSPAQAKQARSRLTWLHILSFWPLPAMLGFHVLKTYYF